ncbi:MAG TPA: hypothetical protein VL974_10690 [Magnetospirillum sp.]|jgi:hypothetical protein|nr:hypothetical protein [Magnetospirillum sp.]
MDGGAYAEKRWREEDKLIAYYGALSDATSAAPEPVADREAPDEGAELCHRAEDVDTRADAAMVRGHSDSLIPITEAAKDVLDRLARVAGRAGHRSGALTDTLTALRNAMEKLSVAGSRAPADIASRVLSELATMDHSAARTAAALGTTWHRSSATVVRLDTRKLVDMRA